MEWLGYMKNENMKVGTNIEENGNKLEIYLGKLK